MLRSRCRGVARAHARPARQGDLLQAAPQRQMLRVSALTRPIDVFPNPPEIPSSSPLPDLGAGSAASRPRDCRYRKDGKYRAAGD
jgi:hypothetical protein